MMSSFKEQYDCIMNNRLDVNSLKKEVEYNKNDCAFFFTKDDPNWLLSNMAGKMPVFYSRSKQWNSSEQLYQATKYPPGTLCVPESAHHNNSVEPDVRKRIEAATNARGAKMTQKCAVSAGLVRKDWDDPDWEIRIYSMLWVLELKLRYNPSTFGKVLRETGTKDIVEISKKDAFWGCHVYGGKLEGQNVLGKLLMMVRDRAPEIKSGEFSHPTGFLLTEGGGAE
ncbi:MAG: hypothetical protein BWK76_27485 [Desulfobulbaceae bacterium A2]|nr:MAG: hypothetical protein BWK76_27485 [Desulfobulbaceae bacterium A2]